MVNLEYVFDCPVEQLQALLCNRQFVTHKLSHLGASQIHIDRFGQNGQVFEFVSRARLGARFFEGVHVPGLVKRFFEKYAWVEQETCWHELEGDVRTGECHVGICDVAVGIDARVVLQQREQGCLFQVSYQSQIQVPMIGRGLSAGLDQLIRFQMARDYQYNRQWLAEHPVTVH